MPDTRADTLFNLRYAVRVLERYARLLAQGCQLGDEALAAQYAGLVAEDGIHVPQGLKLIAYNDVVRERGLDSAALYTNTNRLLACLS